MVRPPHQRRVGGKRRRAHGLTGPRTSDPLQRHTALPSSNFFLPRYLGKKLYTVQHRYPQFAKNPKP